MTNYVLAIMYFILASCVYLAWEIRNASNQEDTGTLLFLAFVFFLVGIAFVILGAYSFSDACERSLYI